MEQNKIEMEVAQWQVLKDSLLKECKNVGLAAEAIGSRDLQITNNNNARQVSLRYNQNVPCISFEGYEGGGHFAFRLNSDGTLVELIDAKRSTPIGIADITVEIMRYLTSN